MNQDLHMVDEPKESRGGNLYVVPQTPLEIWCAPRDSNPEPAD